VSLVGPLLVVVLATVAGATLGIVSAWKGGTFDGLVSRALDVLFAFPALLLAILAVALFGAGLPSAIVALAVAYTPYLARLVRSVALRERQLPYVDALLVQGQRPSRIITRHVVPRLSPFILVQATLSFGYALLDLAALNFLGFGAQPPQADWGSMVAAGLPDLLTGLPAQALSASALIVLSVWLVNELGERLALRWTGGSDV
jgi:peptide/nickel transport system permease protein